LDRSPANIEINLKVGDTQKMIPQQMFFDEGNVVKEDINETICSFKIDCLIFSLKLNWRKHVFVWLKL
jgi:hypothetical protein